MTTIQKQIRDWAAARLLTTTGLTVHRAPRADIPVESLPAICMFSHGDKPANAGADSSRTHERIYTLAVDHTVKGRQEEDATDDLAVKVRHALLVGPDQLSALLPPHTSYITWAGQEWAGKEGEDPLSGCVQLIDFHYLWRPEW